ncbi:MAG TPA: NUDIX domain-containing protein [Stellaceae bacterium]|jgi:8-oxo-dGTP pyrophosphatase MutT (NUDIX family)|nr:NUDIX domain-containing protein [Stellaceae bacterium]
MNDITEPVATKLAIARPRDAASLILMRGEGRDLELLAGRRPAHVKFMPGVWVFPGGAIDPEDRRPWHGETGGEHLPPRLLRSARAALRETWEEVGVLVGRRDAANGSPAATKRAHTPTEAAYAAQGAVPAFDVLTYIGRAITPTRVFRRFNTRFFLADSSAVIGDPVSSDELEDVGWHPIGRQPLVPFRDVTQFMLARAIAVRAGTAPAEAPLFYTSHGERRVGVCREAVLDL